MYVCGMCVYTYRMFNKIVAIVLKVSLHFDKIYDFQFLKTCLFIYLFVIIYLLLLWVFVAVWAFLVVTSRGCSSCSVL